MHTNARLYRFYFKISEETMGEVLLRVQPAIVLSKMEDPISVQITHLKNFLLGEVLRTASRSEGVFVWDL